MPRQEYKQLQPQGLSTLGNQPPRLGMLVYRPGCTYTAELEPPQVPASHLPAQPVLSELRLLPGTGISQQQSNGVYRCHKP